MAHYLEVDTPALLVDKTIMEANSAWMMAKACKAGVKLRPHIKTHRTPAIAKIQIAGGASGITVAKVGEAEVIAAEGIADIFIANEVVGDNKLRRILALHNKIRIAVGVDCREQVIAFSRIFSGVKKPLELMIEVETGEERTGVLSGEAALRLARFIAEHPNLRLRGIFTHEGHTYSAPTPEICVERFHQSQRDILEVARYLGEHGVSVEEISTGATPSLLHGDPLPGITEMRPGTYIFMDAAMGNCVNDYSRCAITVLTTVISKPTEERVVTDAGVKALTSFTRNGGICNTPGYGLVFGFDDVRVKKVYDEHGVIENKTVHAKVHVGDKLRIIPNHVCPCCNLYDKMYIMENEQIVAEWPILCRGKSQ